MANCVWFSFLSSLGRFTWNTEDFLVMKKFLTLELRCSCHSLDQGTLNRIGTFKNVLQLTRQFHAGNSDASVMQPNTADVGNKSLAWSTDQKLLTGPLLLRVLVSSSCCHECSQMMRLLCRCSSCSLKPSLYNVTMRKGDVFNSLHSPASAHKGLGKMVFSA